MFSCQATDFLSFYGHSSNIMTLVTSSAVFAALVAVFAYSLSTFIMSIGLNRRVYNHVPGECSSIGNFHDGISDFETAFDGSLFISAGRCYENCSTGHFGRILTYNVDNKSAWQLEITGSKLRVNPGGISLSPSKSKMNLFVINHRKKTSVEILAYNSAKRTIKHLKTVKSKKFNNLVDVAAIDKQKFFATSHTYFSSNLLKTAEMLLNVNSGSIIYFDGKKSETVAHLATPAGIVYDSFRRLLFVASLTSEFIRVYSVDNDNSLTFKQDINLFCGPFSLWQDIDNSLVVTCNPIKIRYLTYLWNNTEYFSPTQVLKVYYRSKDIRPTITQLYSNDGATVSAAHSALRAGNTLLIGARSDMLSCELLPVESPL